MASIVDGRANRRPAPIFATPTTGFPHFRLPLAQRNRSIELLSAPQPNTMTRVARVDLRPAWVDHALWFNRHQRHLANEVAAIRELGVYVVAVAHDDGVATSCFVPAEERVSVATVGRHER